LNVEKDLQPIIKGIIDDFIAKYTTFIDDNKLKEIIFKRIKEQYDAGLVSGEIQFNMNFTPNYKTLSFIQNFGFDNVKKLSADMKDELRKQLVMGLMNKETMPYLTKRVQLVLDATIERAKMITITETNRAFNMGHFQAAEESRLDLVKQWSAQPERNEQNPCPICEEMDGSIVEMNDKFHFSDGESLFLAPKHPRCKCRVLYIQRANVKIKAEAEFNGKPGKWRTIRGHPVFISEDGTMYGGDGKEFKFKEEKSIQEQETENLEKHKKSVEKAYEKVPLHKLETIKKNQELANSGKDTQGLHSKNGEYSLERRKSVHKDIVDKYKTHFDSAKSSKPKVVFMAGIPAAGKTFATKSKFDYDSNGIIATHKDSGEKYLILNPDNFKKELPEYDGGLGANIVHEESSHLNKHLIKEAMANGVNIIVDATMSNADKAKKLLDSFHTSGYKSELIHVVRDVEEAIESALERFEHTGRFVAFENIPRAEPGVLDSVSKVKDLFHSFVEFQNKRK
jgi:predicted kinase